MRKRQLFIVVAMLALVGAGCAKKTTTNINTSTNTTVTNTATTTGNTTGTFTTNSSTTTTVNTNREATNTNTAANATLIITSSGISPKTLTVDRGTVVTIVNNDSRSHQINSNPHPDHTDLPDLINSISAGSSSTYTFTKTGSWGYHDHNDPFDEKWKGTVVVQ